MKNRNEPIGKATLDLPACTACLAKKTEIDDDNNNNNYYYYIIILLHIMSFQLFKSPLPITGLYTK
jgi:hypothetical protein